MKPAILVVDDNRILASTIAQSLHAQGYEAAWATNARQAQRMFESGQFDGALIDIDLRGRVNGIELLNTLQLSAPRLPAALMSGGDTSDIDLPTDVCVLRKPFKVGQVIAVLFEPISKGTPMTNESATPPPREAYANDVQEQIEALANTMQALIRALPPGQRTAFVSHFNGLTMKGKGEAYSAMIARMR